MNDGPGIRSHSADRVDHARIHRKTRDQALVLLLAGVVLLFPPLAGIFQLDGRIAGVPLTLIYLFTVWAGLILGAAKLARRLRDTDPQSGLGAPQRGADTGIDAGRGEKARK